MDTNVFTCVGRIVEDPRGERTVGTGSTVSTFRIVVNGRTDKDTIFIDVDGWNRTSDIIQKLAKKSRRVHVLGKLMIDEFQDKKTQMMRKVPKIRATEITFLDPPPDSGGGQPPRSESNDGPSMSQRQRMAQQYEAQREAAQRRPAPAPPPSGPPTEAYEDDTDNTSDELPSLLDEDERDGLPPRPDSSNDSGPDDEVPF